EYTNVFAGQIRSWLMGNATKRPQYVVLFPDIPSRVNTDNTPGNYTFDLDGGPCYPYPQRHSVQYQLASWCMAGWMPFVTSLHVGDTNACRAYIDKVTFIGTNYSPGKLLIGGYAGSYGNTNYYFDETVIDYY